MRNKTLKNRLTAQFYRGNMPMLCLAVFASLVCGTLNLILSWIMQQLIDAASGVPGALPLGLLARLCGIFVLLCVAASLLQYASEPRFIRRAMRQYKDFAFEKLMEKSISSFRDEGTAAYLSALTNDASSIEADFLSQQLSVITKAVTFSGALALMLWYSPLMTAIAVGVTVLPLIASVLTGRQIAAAERRVSDRNRDFTSALGDCLAGFSVVKTFKAEREIFRLFAEKNRALEDEKFGRRRVKILVGMIGSVAGVLAQLGVFLIGAYLALTGRGLTPGIVIAFVNLMNFMIAPVAELPGLLASRKAGGRAGTEPGEYGKYGAYAAGKRDSAGACVFRLRREKGGAARPVRRAGGGEGLRCGGRQRQREIDAAAAADGSPHGLSGADLLRRNGASHR